jgi:hypothetical protein
MGASVSPCLRDPIEDVVQHEDGRALGGRRAAYAVHALPHREAPQPGQRHALRIVGYGPVVGGN